MKRSLFSFACGTMRECFTTDASVVSRKIPIEQTFENPSINYQLLTL